MRIKSIQPLRPNQSVVNKIASLPYDVVTRQEAKNLAESNPLSFLRVIRAEIDLPDTVDPYSDEVYAQAVNNLKWLQSEGHLIREEEPCLYLYEQQMNDHIQRGLVALCHIDDYEKNLIKKHEKTRPVKENDRTRLNNDLNANPGPVFLTYKDNSSIDELADKISQQEPLFNFVAEDGIKHTVWKISDTNPLVDAYKNIACFYVADGHHRSASAARVAKERRDNNSAHTGDENYNWFLCVLFPASQLKILPYNRIVRDLNGLSSEEFLNKIKNSCTVTVNVDPTPSSPNRICMYLNNIWYGLDFNNIDNCDPVSVLDVSKLQDHILTPLLGIEDIRTSQRIEFVGGIRGIDPIVNEVDSESFAVGFSLFPVSIEQLIAISDADRIMPPKSTWFEPKLRSGLIVHTF